MIDPKTVNVWDKVRKVINANTGIPIMLRGIHGTGKSTFPLAVAKNTKRPVFTDTLTPTYEVDGRIWGHFKMGKTGEFMPHYGVGTNSWLADNDEGGILVLDELDACPDAWPAVYRLADSRNVARMDIFDGRTIKPGPKYQLVCTMNPAVNLLPPALVDRFIVFNINEPNPEAVSKLPADLQKLAKACVGKKDEKYLSLRRLFAFAKLRDAFPSDELEIAADVVFNERSGDIIDGMKIEGGMAKEATSGPF